MCQHKPEPVDLEVDVARYGQGFKDSAVEKWLGLSEQVFPD